MKKKLNNGKEIPMLGLGVFRLEDGPQVEETVASALEAGYRHIDTAAAYGNEEGVGRAIAESGIPREEIFVTTKLWNQHQRESAQRQAIEDSLNRLGMDYIDLYLIHWPVKGKWHESWQIMEEYCGKGVLRSIGVSNFLEHHLDDLLTQAKIVPAVNQVECHPHLSQEPLVAYCERLGIAFEAWSPLGGGKIPLTQDPVLVQIGKKYGKSAAQVILRWEIQRGIITIPKSANPGRIAENAAIFDFALTDEDMAAVGAMNKDARVGSHPDHFTF